MKNAREQAKHAAEQLERLRIIENEREKELEVARRVLGSLAVDDEQDGENDEQEEEGVEEEGDEEDEDEGNSLPSKASTKKYSSYMPPKDSCLWVEMNKHEQKWKRGNGAFAVRDKLWLLNNENDPVAKNARSPEAWYKSNFNIFTWMPSEQFGTQVDFSKIKCIHGCNGCNVKKHGTLCWRPMFRLEGIVWVLHQRLQCCECKKSFTTIDPNFLSQLPTRVVERFPFFCTRRGPGIHNSLIFHFISLIGKGIMYGSYVDSINELHKIRYAMESISYYDTIADTLQSEMVEFAPKVRP